MCGLAALANVEKRSDGGGAVCSRAIPSGAEVNGLEPSDLVKADVRNRRGG